MVNAGIVGNCLLREIIGPRALDRLERDVLDQPGVAWVITLEGINDIGIGWTLGQPVTAEQLMDGYLELIEAAHARGLLVYGATLLPHEGASYFNESDEQVREAVNEWIRNSGSFDAVLDFDAVTRDPTAPTRLLPFASERRGVFGDGGRDRSRAVRVRRRGGIVAPVPGRSVGFIRAYVPVVERIDGATLL